MDRTPAILVILALGGTLATTLFLLRETDTSGPLESENVEVPAGSGLSARRSLVAPTASAEAETHAPAEDAVIHLSGRLVDEAGAPLATKINLRLESSEAAPVSVWPRTGDDGRFHVFVPCDGYVGHEISLTAWASSTPRGQLHGRLGLSIPDSAEHDVGDVALHRFPIVAAGIIVDDTGRPRPNFGIRLVDWRTRPHYEGRPVTSCGEGGRFELRGGWEAGEEIHLQAFAPSFIGDWTVKWGREDLVLQATRVGQVRARVHLSGDFEPERLKLVIDGNPDRLKWPTTSFRDDDGTYELVVTKVPVGLREIAVTLDDHPIAEGSVRVRWNRMAELPLVGIDARHRTIEVVATAPDGSPVECVLHATCGEVEVRPFRCTRSIVVPEGPCVLRVHPMSDYRIEVIEEPRDVVHLVLRPALQIVLTHDRDLPAGTWLEVIVDDIEMKLSEGRELRTSLQRTGTMSLIMSLCIPSGTRGARMYRVSPRGATVEILDEPLQILELPVAEALWEEAVRGIEPR